MPPRADPPLHPLDQAVTRFHAASLLDKPRAAETAVAALVDHVKQLEARLAALEACRIGPR